jgi:hypothetical protein
MSWKCKTCGLEHDDLPLCFGFDAPWPMLVPEDEFDRRVELFPDLCMVDGTAFFIRGHIEIPIIDHPDSFCLSVWSSLSKESYEHVKDRWVSPDRGNDPPYSGYLSSAIPVYPDTIHLKLAVQTREPGLIPLMTVEQNKHPLALDQHRGISIQRWHELAHCLLHDWLQ